MVGIPGFAVVDEIGRGGFGTVHRARDLTSGTDVAVKVLAASAGSEQHEQFDAECRAIRSLPAHPGLPRVLAAGRTDEGLPYVATPLLPGGSLADRVPMPAAAAVEVCARLADILQVAHEAGIVHRDVKPANVLFDAADRPVLVDFGIASRAGAATVSASDAVAVSIGFAAPEVLAGASADASADVYALGATLFCLLTGRPPFVPRAGSEPVAVVAARIARAPVDDLRPDGVPAAVCRVLEQAMAKDPAARQPSAAALAVALRGAARELRRPVAGLRRASRTGGVLAAGSRRAAARPGRGVAAVRRAPLPALLAALVLIRWRGRGRRGQLLGLRPTDRGRLAGPVDKGIGGDASAADAIAIPTQPGSTGRPVAGAPPAGPPPPAGPRCPARRHGRPPASRTTGRPDHRPPDRAHPTRRARPPPPGRHPHPVTAHPTTPRPTPTRNHAPSVSAHGGTFAEHASTRPRRPHRRPRSRPRHPHGTPPAVLAAPVRRSS